MVWAIPSISNSSNPQNKPLGIVPWAPIISDTTVTFMLHNFLLFGNVQLVQRKGKKSLLLSLLLVVVVFVVLLKI